MINECSESSLVTGRRPSHHIGFIRFLYPQHPRHLKLFRLFPKETQAHKTQPDQACNHIYTRSRLIGHPRVQRPGRSSAALTQISR
ncbi:hypothetical protein AOLI_G00300510 [Acnodon oligacanthus]